MSPAKTAAAKPSAADPGDNKPTLMLLDGNSLAFRAFYALPALANRAGVPTNAALGFVWAAAWWFWFRDNPREHTRTNDAECKIIEEGIATPDETQAAAPSVPFVQLVTSANVLLAMFQYAASNITFFIAITWLRPYMEDR